jgi:hypothetical protein
MSWIHKILGSDGATILSVDATPKAARVTLYDGAGNALQPNAVYSGIATVKVRQSAATGAGVVVWGIHNPNATKVVNIRNIFLELFFDGTAVATNMEYEILKMTGITTFSGGAVVTPSHKVSSQSGAQVSVVRVLDTGLTTTGGAAQAQAAIFAMGRAAQTTTSMVRGQYEPIKPNVLTGVALQLVQNEALVIRQLVTSVIGDRIQGWIDFAEV